MKTEFSFFFIFVCIFYILFSCSSPELGDKITEEAIFPEIISSTIPDNSEGILSDASLTILFSHPMNRDSVIRAADLLMNGEELVDCCYSWNRESTSFTIKPVDLLQKGYFYLFMIKSDAESEKGFRLKEEYKLTFVTVREDNISPEIIGTCPDRENSTIVGCQDIVVQFSEEMVRETVESAFSLQDMKGDTIDGQFEWIGNNMHFTPAVELGAFETYSFMVTGAALDTAGNRLKEGVNLTFQVYGKVELTRKIEGNDSTGSGDSGFDWLTGVAVAPDGMLYIVDRKTHSISKFAPDGTFVAKWGNSTSGAEDGEFDKPTGVAVDDECMVYVTDIGNNRVQKFSADGKFITKWGRVGRGEGEFNEPHGITIDHEGSVYVADRVNDRIQKFTSEGEFKGVIISLVYPVDMAVDQQGSVYVVDCEHRVIKFSAEGKCLEMWGKGDALPGSGDGEFRFPDGIAVDPDGFIYVVDSENHRIQKFNSRGQFITKWGRNGGDGTVGSGDGEFNNPSAVTVDREGQVYVVDRLNSRVQVFRIVNK